MNKTMTIGFNFDVKEDFKEDFSDSSLSAKTRYSILMDQWCNLAYGLQNGHIGKDEMTESFEGLMESLDIPPLSGCAFIHGFRETLKEDNVGGVKLDNGLILYLD